MSASRKPLLLGIILGFALLLRLIGLQFGAPLVVHPEESDLLVHAMQAGAESGNPGWFEYPSAMIYWTLLVQGVRYVATGAASPAEFWDGYKADPFPYHVWVRATVAFFGALGVYAIWLLGNEWDRGRSQMRILGWGSATLLAVHFLHVRDSHFATIDIPVTTAITFALWLILREFHRERTNVRRMLGIALFVGFACGIKYTAAPLLFPLMYVAYDNLIRDEKEASSFGWLLGSGALLLVAVGFGFLVTTPYAILDAPQFWKDLGYRWFTSKAHAPLFGGGEPFLVGYLQGPWMWGGGKVIAVLGFFGFMMAVLRHEPEDRVLLAFAIPYYLLICSMMRVWGKWFLPIAVLEVLWAVRFIAVYCHHPWLEATLGLKGRRAIAVGSVLLLAVTTLVPTLRLDVLLRKPDSRALALEDLPKFLDEGDYVLVTEPPFYCPPVPKEVPRINEDGLLRERGPREEDRTFTLDMPNLGEVLDRGINKLIYSSFYWDSAFQPFIKQAYPGSETYRSFVADLKREGEVLWRQEASASGVGFHPENLYAPTFSLWRWQRPGPGILLYELPPEWDRPDAGE